MVASQGVSTLDNHTALEWMRTRLPEAAQLINPGSSLTQPVLSPKVAGPVEQEKVSEDSSEAAHDSGGGTLNQDVPADAIEGQEPETAQRETLDIMEQEAMADQTEKEEEAPEAHGSGVGTSAEGTLAFKSREEEAQTAESIGYAPKQDGTPDHELLSGIQDTSVGAQTGNILGGQHEDALADATTGRHRA